MLTPDQGIDASMNVSAAALPDYGSHDDPTVTAAVQGCWSRSRTTVPAMRS